MVKGAKTEKAGKEDGKSTDIKVKDVENIQGQKSGDSQNTITDKSRKKGTETTIVESDIQLEADVKSTGEEFAKESRKTKKELKAHAKRIASILTTEIDVKDVGFETALTKEEKAEKRKAKKLARQAAKEAKLAASGELPAKEKKPKKSAKKKKSSIIAADAVAGDEEIAVAEGEKQKEDGGEKKPEGEDKKKGKKKGKKDKNIPKEQEVDTKVPTAMDLLRKQASMLMEDFDTHRKQSLLLQGNISLINTKRPSMLPSKNRRKTDTKLQTKQRGSLVQLNEDEDSSSSSGGGAASEMNVVAKKEKKGKKKKDKKGIDREQDKKKPAKKKKKESIKASMTETEEQLSLMSSLTKQKRHKSPSRVEFHELSGSGGVRKMSGVSDVIEVSGYSPEDEERKKRRREKTTVQAKRAGDDALKTGEIDQRSENSKTIDGGSKRGSRTSRTSRFSRASKASNLSSLRRKRSVDYDYDNEPMIHKEMPPMVPLAVETSSLIDLDVKKKGKKGKKKEVKEVPMEELSAMEQIERMKAQALASVAAAMQPEEEVVPKTKEKKEKKEKKKKGKKMGKGKSVSNAERLEQERLAAEAEAAAAAEAERIRLNEERRMASDKAKKETLEQNIRNEQLQTSIENMLRFRDKQLAHAAMVKQEEEWIEYLTCDGLPDPTHCADMNTYLHLWEKDLPSVDMEEAERKTNEVLKLLEVMDLLIASPYFDDYDKVTNWKWVRGLVREHQVTNLDTATYRLLRNIAENMNRLDIPTADFRLKSELFSLCVWLKVQLPIPIRNPRTPAPPRIKLKFPEMEMKVFFPTSLVCKQMAIRAMYLKYDHLSDTCRTFEIPPTPEHYKITLQQTMANEWYQKMLYKYNNRPKRRKKEITLEDGTTTWVEPEPEPELLPGQMPPPVPYKALTPNAEDYVLQMEENVYKNSREILAKAVQQSVLNMREYVILGGVFSLDLYYQPPQPQSMVTYDLTFTTLQRPLSLQAVQFYQEYRAPIAFAAGTRRTPEEIEEELKQQEAEMDKLILLNISMPQHVIWLDVPMVVHWDRRNKLWTRKHVYDFKHVEEKNYITFRTGAFGTFALATNKYASLPYQAWELKPEIDGTVTLQITTALLMLEFNIKESLVSMTQLQNSPNNALQDIVGKYYKLSMLKKLLVEGGVDIFPEADSFCYIARTCEKHYPTEKHMYEQMAQLAGVFNFSWSRWNLPAGRRTIVCQMREYKPDKPRQKGHSMLMVTPLRAVFIDCTEVSPVFSEVPTTEDSKMCADLYHLMKATFNVAIRVKVNSQPADMVNTLADLLIQTRVNSFS